MEQCRGGLAPERLIRDSRSRDTNISHIFRPDPSKTLVFGMIHCQHVTPENS